MQLFPAAGEPFLTGNCHAVGEPSEEVHLVLAQEVSHGLVRVELLPRHLVLTGPTVASELAIPLKSASAALRDLVDAGVLVEHGAVQPKGPGRPSRVYTSPELLGLSGSNPLRV